MSVPTASEFDRIQGDGPPGVAEGAAARLRGARSGDEGERGVLGGEARVLGGPLSADLEIPVPVEEALDGLDDLPCAREPVARVERRRADADRVELGRQVEARRTDAGPRVGAEEGRRERGLPGTPRMQGLEGEELEEERPQGIHVGAGVDGFAAHLLGRHVTGRAHGGSVDAPAALSDAAGARQRGSLHGALELREAPVEQINLAEVPEHHVPGLEVAMDHAACVREVERLTDARERRQELAPRELPRRVRVVAAERGEDLLEGRAAEALHREVDGPVGIASQVVDGDDRRVLELALHARLPEEPSDEVGARRVLGAHHLERDVAPDATVAAGVDDPHPAFAKLVAERVAEAEGAVVGGVRVRRGPCLARKGDKATRQVRDGDAGIVGRHSGMLRRPFL